MIRDVDVKDGAKDVGSFSGGDGEGDVEGEDQAKNVLRVVDFCNIDEGLKRSGMVKFFGLEQIFAVNIAELKLRRFISLQGLFRWVEFFESVDAMRTVVVAAFMNNDVQTYFPAVQGILAVRTEVFSFK